MAFPQSKEAILKEIFDEIEKGIVNEKNLDRLENLVKILHEEGSKAPIELVQEAYCQVAVECTAKYLTSKDDFIDAIGRIWISRIIPLCDKVSCLVTSELLNSGKRLWEAYKDESFMNDDEKITKEKALVCLKKVVSELHPNLCFENVLRDDEFVENDEEYEDDVVVVANLCLTNNAPTKPSSIERKRNAQTFESKDFIDDSCDRERNNNAKGKRRMRVRWSTAETLAVLKGYEMYGADWKRIKDENPILYRRTNIDIKDKYRVEMKHGDPHPLSRLL